MKPQLPGAVRAEPQKQFFTTKRNGETMDANPSPRPHNRFCSKKLKSLIWNYRMAASIVFAKPVYVLMAIFFIANFSCTKISESPTLENDEESSITGSAQQKLNIILIIEDDIGYEIPTYTGGQSYKTPVMDSLAAAGMQFTHCYAHAMCSPSRITLLTGKYGFRNYHNWGVLDTTQKTIANMLKDHGYATCMTGKWQLDGGDRSIHKFGFNDYAVFDPFDELPRSNDSIENLHRYKNPTIYQYNHYLPDATTNGKFSDNIFANFACNFIQIHKDKPFFIYFSFSECHSPFFPPPNNPAYASYDPLTYKGTTKNFPNMVNYMDSRIRVLINKVKSLGLLNKTVFIVIGDNGTENSIISKYKGRAITGGKAITNEFGLHVPLIVTGSGVAVNSINKNMIDLTDFMPTIAQIAGISQIELSKYGVMDGSSFYTQLQMPNSAGRSWSYGYYYPLPNTPSQKRIYVQDTMYKLYDNTNHNYFYNLQKDSLERYPIPDDKLTDAEKQKKANFQQILSGMHN